jgi:hypothetical protein
LQLNAIRTGKPQVAVDAAANKIFVYYSDRSHEEVDASDVNARSVLRKFANETHAQIYESLPNHWNAVQVAKE